MKKSNDIVEMEVGEDGAYQEKKGTSIKKPSQVQKYQPNLHPNPQAYPSKKLMPFYEFLSGFVVGLDAMENFLKVVKGQYRR